jgi:hypothetical protein
MNSTNEENRIKMEIQRIEMINKSIKASNIFTFDNSTCINMPIPGRFLGWSAAQLDEGIKIMTSNYFGLVLQGPGSERFASVHMVLCSIYSILDHYEIDYPDVVSSLRQYLKDEAIRNGINPPDDDSSTATQQALTCNSECQSRKDLEDRVEMWRNRIVIPYELNADTDIPADETVPADDIPNPNAHLTPALWRKYNEYKRKTIQHDNVKQLLNNLVKQQLSTENDNATIMTNNRKIVYEELAKEQLYKVGNVLTGVYVIVLILYIYFNLILENEWKNVKAWIIPTLLIIIPFIINYIAIMLRLIYNKILWLISNKLYRNVYV